MFFCECSARAQQCCKCSKRLCGSGTGFSLSCVSGSGLSLWCGSRCGSDFYFDADPRIRESATTGLKTLQCSTVSLQGSRMNLRWLYCEPPQLPAFYYDADPDPESIFMCIRLRFPKLMRIRKSWTMWHGQSSGRVPLRKFMICCAKYVKLQASICEILATHLPAVNNDM